MTPKTAGKVKLTEAMAAILERMLYCAVFEGTHVFRWGDTGSILTDAQKRRVLSLEVGRLVEYHSFAYFRLTKRGRRALRESIK